MSVVRDGHRTFYLTVPDDFYDALDTMAQALDVETGIYALALLLGAYRSGNADRHAMAGLDHVPHKRRAQRRREWVAEGPTGAVDDGVSEAACWRHGGWTMVRLGHPSRTQNPDEGWFLEGPGVADATHVGWKRKEAQERADEIITHYEREQVRARQEVLHKEAS